MTKAKSDKPKSSTAAARRSRGLKQVVFWWPKDVVDVLDAEAKRRGVTRAALVAHMLEQGS
jgi:hypothetical protein